MMGVINLDKPVGPTSHDMVGLVRRLTATRRIGHAGTLDPLASGVLPILVGAATRFSEELTGGAKRYEATIRLGWRSATDDAEGPLLATGAALPPIDRVRAALPTFAGEIEQRPPAYSARKVAGRTAYRAARAGEPIELPARRVRIDGIELLGWDEAADRLDLRVDLRCGPGTYVRSIARDLGEALGCGGYLAVLRRTEAAGLRANDSLVPARLEELAAHGSLAEALVPVEALLRLPHLRLSADEAARFVHGSPIHPRDAAGADGRRAVFSGAMLLGIGRMQDGQLQPEKVIAEAGA